MVALSGHKPALNTCRAWPGRCLNVTALMETDGDVTERLNRPSKSVERPVGRPRKDKADAKAAWQL